ncbi:putative lipase-like isoform 2 [Capsicum annuum]|nr:putative lipase-like isoform 2 [Capsicum annuum]
MGATGLKLEKALHNQFPERERYFGLQNFAVASDLSQALSDCFYKNSNNLEINLKSDYSKKNVTSVKDLPAILLVHGIFGFEKGRLGGLSYFVGAEKKDDRVLVPDLIFGSPNDDLSNSNMTSEFKNKPDGWETTSKTQDGNIWEMSKREEDILVQEFERRIAFNKFQAFKGYENTSENWVLSITALSGAFNGTTRTYFDGLKAQRKTVKTPVDMMLLTSSLTMTFWKVCACDTNCCNAFVVPACSGNYKGVTEDVGCSYIVVTNRTECCQGLEQDITSKISAGCVYTVSARAGVSVTFHGSIDVQASLRLVYQNA